MNNILTSVSLSISMKQATHRTATLSFPRKLLRQRLETSLDPLTLRFLPLASLAFLNPLSESPVLSFSPLRAPIASNAPLMHRVLTEKGLRVRALESLRRGDSLQNELIHRARIPAVIPGRRVVVTEDPPSLLFSTFRVSSSPDSSAGIPPRNCRLIRDYFPRFSSPSTKGSIH